MNVTFSRTGERRYRVSVEGPGVVSSWMEPAPGYDARLPHDMAHFVVENELRIVGGVFGQLASGGLANTFHPYDEKARRKLTRRSKGIAAANVDDAVLSEKIVWLACRTWNHENVDGTTIKGVSDEDIRRVCLKFDEVSFLWSNLAVGESMTLNWKVSSAGGRHSRSRGVHESLEPARRSRYRNVTR